jgi:hypothetical protein
VNKKRKEKESKKERKEEENLVFERYEVHYGRIENFTFLKVCKHGPLVVMANIG